MKGEITQKTVDDSMNSAVENGYTFVQFTSVEIAEDIAEYDSDFEGVDVSRFLPFVEDWKRRNPNL